MRSPRPTPARHAARADVRRCSRRQLARRSCCRCRRGAALSPAPAAQSRAVQCPRAPSAGAPDLCRATARRPGAASAERAAPVPAMRAWRKRAARFRRGRRGGAGLHAGPPARRARRAPYVPTNSGRRRLRTGPRRRRGPSGPSAARLPLLPCRAQKPRARLCHVPVAGLEPCGLFERGGRLVKAAKARQGRAAAAEDVARARL